MFFIKTSNGQVEQYPYTLGNLRRDNSNTSFPRNIPDEVLESYGVYQVTETTPPDVDNKTHRVTQTAQLVDGTWTQIWESVPLDIDVAEGHIRGHRDKLLRDTDYLALSDNTLSTEMSTYRLALRDITTQEGFPHNVTWPSKP